MDSPALVLDGLSRTYQGVIKAVEGVSLTVEQGELVTLLGPSGSGKSTLLAMMAGFERASGGTIEVAGRPIDAWPQEHLRTRLIGFLFQRFHLFEHLSAVRNVELALFPTCPDPAERHGRSRELLERVGLAHRVDARAVHLSGGERQRVAFCRSIANRPRILLADEPTGSLDMASKALLLELLRQHVSEQGGTLVVATHDPQVSETCTRVLRLRDGRLLSEDE